MHSVAASISTVAAEWDGHMGGGWMWLSGSLMMLALVVVTALVVWGLTRGARADRSNGASGPTERARSILAERLARGEIEPDEYDDRLRHLG